jgi:hypothetical protein
MNEQMEKFPHIVMLSTRQLQSVVNCQSLEIRIYTSSCRDELLYVFACNDVLPNMDCREFFSDVY